MVEARERARAAIEAIREPDKAMMDAGYAVGHEEAPAAYYRAMVDAALQDGESSNAG